MGYKLDGRVAGAAATEFDLNRLLIFITYLIYSIINHLGASPSLRSLILNSILYIISSDQVDTRLNRLRIQCSYLISLKCLLSALMIPLFFICTFIFTSSSNSSPLIFFFYYFISQFMLLSCMRLLRLIQSGNIWVQD